MTPYEQKQVANTLPFSCPTCHAQPGEQCVILRGKRVAHLARQDKYIRAYYRGKRQAS